MRKIKIYANGVPLEIYGRHGPVGKAGPDGTPLGTIISFMGVSPPTGYLICDGSEYLISEHPDLSEFFTEQFGTNNFFGGDGVTTFALPDLRNLFLRGYHAESEEQFSGDIGAKQEATKIPYVYSVRSGGNFIQTGYDQSSNIHVPLNTDSLNDDTGHVVFVSGSYTASNDNVNVGIDYYTARPVNTAVLFCIKAIPSKSVEDIYSTDELRIGTWIDGKPLYRRVFNILSPSAVSRFESKIKIEYLDTICNLVMLGRVSTDGNWEQELRIHLRYARSITPSDEIGFYASSGSRVNQPITVVVEYTKTTDDTTIGSQVSALEEATE